MESDYAGTLKPKLEVYLMTVQVCREREKSKTVPLQISKTKTYADLKSKICELFRLPDDETTRIWECVVVPRHLLHCSAFISRPPPPTFVLARHHRSHTPPCLHVIIDPTHLRACTPSQPPHTSVLARHHRSHPPPWLLRHGAHFAYQQPLTQMYLMQLHARRQSTACHVFPLCIMCQNIIIYTSS
jgi:hypothetical protein